MKVYTIYEIPGVKVGCDADWPTRAKEQGVKPEDCIVLQQETDIIQVSIDEIWWQIEKDYPVDTIPYFIAVMINKERGKRAVLAGAPSKAGKVGGPIVGRKTLENGTGIFGMSEEAKFNRNSKGGSISGPTVGRKHVESGHWAKIAALAVKGKICINNGIETIMIYPERLQEFYSKGWVKGRLPRR
jgi:hypothetical protein